jgi:ATP-dependent Clp protease protease subunit
VNDKGFAVDIFSYLAMERILFLEETTDESAQRLVSQMLYLDYVDSGKDIHLYINHGGGSVYAGLAIIDTMHRISSDVSTFSVGLTASMGAVILCAGAKGKRFALPNATIMMHQGRYLSEIRGPVSTIQTACNELVRLEYIINELIAHQTGQPLEKIRRDTSRDFYLNSKEAQGYGIIDHIIGA